MIDSMHGDIIQWLRGFYYIAQTGSIRRAAELMNRTPSTLSYGLKSLEAELDTVLFDREGNRLKITPEGEKLMTWTISTFETLKGMKAELSCRPGSLHGEASFSTVLPLAVRLADAVAMFHSANPGVCLDIRRGMVDRVVLNVDDGVTDFGVVSTATPPEQCDFENVFSSRPVLLIPSGMGDAVSSRPDMEELKKLPFVSYLADVPASGGFSMTCDVRSFCERKPVISVNNYHLMIHYVMRGLGCAIMDEICLKATMFGGVDGTGIELRPLQHIFPMIHHGIIMRRRKHLSPQAAELLKYVRRGLQGVGAEYVGQASGGRAGEAAQENDG